MEEYNRQASEFIFKENNASGRVPADTIDLHGQFVEEAEEILEERIKYAKAHGQTHLHVYVRLFSLVAFCLFPYCGDWCDWKRLIALGKGIMLTASQHRR